jgi:hypothetical protein
MGKDDIESSKSGTTEPNQQAGQSGGVNVSGGSNTFQGDVVGRDKVVQIGTQGISEETFQQLFVPLLQSLQQASPEKRQEAEQKVEALKDELSKGKDADDSRVAKLLDGIVALVPGAISAVANMFASPILAGIAGPVTKFVLDKFSGN